MRRDPAGRRLSRSKRLAVEGPAKRGPEVSRYGERRESRIEADAVMVPGNSS